MSVNPRLNRLFTPKGKCLQVALDHGVANEPSALPGMENMQQVVGAIAAANPDAMILTLGQAHWLQDLAQKPKPAWVVRADIMNVYTVPTPKELFCKFIDDVVEQAVPLDAAAVVVNLFWSPDQPDLHWQCVENIVGLKPRCQRYGIPLMVEPMILLPDGKGGYKTNPDIHRTVALARQAVELGADIVKADIAENVNEYHLVVEAAAPRPLLPRGGARVPDQEILTRTYALIRQGASGIVYGRNIYQHPHPARMVRACQAVVHEGATVAQATKILTDPAH
ncbi:MAG: aldolase [Terriglobia bacterium]|jgi:fructose-bisphosphate aldolase, class I